jgi:hypothetical protein
MAGKSTASPSLHGRDNVSPINCTRKHNKLFIHDDGEVAQISKSNEYLNNLEITTLQS